MIEHKIRAISNWKPENQRESDAMRSLVMTEMNVNKQPVNEYQMKQNNPVRDMGISKNIK